MKSVLAIVGLFWVISCGSSPPLEWAVPVSSDGLSAQCESGEGMVCAALMQQANTKEEFSHYGQRACKNGQTRACEYLGNMFFIRSRAPRDGEDASVLVAQSKEMYELGCQHSAWYSCVLVAEMGAPSLELQKKAQTLTEEACLENGTHEACEMLTRSYQDAGDLEEAKALATKGCKAFLANAQEADWDALRATTRVCDMAKNFGVSEDTLRPVIPATGTTRVPSATLEAKRTSGNPQIHPPSAVTWQMSRKGPKRVEAEFRLCLSTLGRISDINLTISSGFPTYDRKLFEKMQKWRYSPYLEDERPAPVCTSVTFVFLQP